MDYWEDRVAKLGKMDDYEKAINKFRKARNKRQAQHVLYDELQSCGIYPEEADEMVNLEMQE